MTGYSLFYQLRLSRRKKTEFLKQLALWPSNSGGPYGDKEIMARKIS